MPRIVRDLHEHKHDRNFHKHAYDRGKCNWARRTEKCNRNSNRELEKVRSADHARRSSDIMRQFQELACEIRYKEDQKSLDGEWNRDQKDVQWILQNHITLE